MQIWPAALNIFDETCLSLFKYNFCSKRWRKFVFDAYSIVNLFGIAYFSRLLSLQVVIDEMIGEVFGWFYHVVWRCKVVSINEILPFAFIAVCLLEMIKSVFLQLAFLISYFTS